MASSDKHVTGKGVPVGTPHAAQITPERYRAHYLAADIAQCRIAVLVLIAPLAPFIYVDYLQHGWSSVFLQLAAARGGFAVYTLWLWYRLPRVTRASQLDHSLVLWALAGTAMVWFSEIVTPRDFVGHYSIDVWIVVIFFAALPLPTRTKMFPALVFSVAEVLTLLLHKEPPRELDTIYTVIGFALAIASGAVLSARVHRYRRDVLLARLETEYQANTDPLTGLANRRSFMHAAAAECERHERRGDPLAVILLDLDKFKHINDTHGHETGDVVLAECARRMTKVLRTYDLCARIGGEEFCVVMPDTLLEAALVTAERIRQALAGRPVRHRHAEVRISASLGVAQWQPGDGGIEPALARADRALYQAKRAGRNRVAAKKSAVRVASASGRGLRHS